MGFAFCNFEKLSPPPTQGGGGLGVGPYIGMGQGGRGRGVACNPQWINLQISKMHIHSIKS